MEKEYRNFISPKGKTNYCFLFKPFQERYKVTLIFEPDQLKPVREGDSKLDIGIDELMRELTDEGFEYMKNHKDNLKYKKRFVKHDTLKPELDEEGEPTGNLQMSFHSSNPPLVIGPDGSEIPDDYLFGPGCEAVVKFATCPMMFKGGNPPIAGVTCYLNAIKFYKLVPFKGASDEFSTDEDYASDEDDDDTSEEGADSSEF